MMHAAVGLWVLSAVIYVGRGHHYFVHGNVKTVKDAVVDDRTDSVALVNEANQEFSFRLYRQLAAHADSQGENIIFCPFCVSTALAALSVGAQGETHRQLFSGLGFNNSLVQKEVDQAFQMFLQRANNQSQEDSSEGTAMFMDDRFKPKPEFLQTLKQSYFTDGFNVDFSQTTESADTINKYMEEKMTNGRIDQLVEDLDPNTVMYLISYIYYKGKWATQFDPELTEQDDFNMDENTKVPVFMMNLEDSFYTYHDDKLKTTVLQLPLNSSYSMLLMLPEVMTTLENAISLDNVIKWLTAMRPRRYNLYIPKFSIKTSYKLNNMLSEMGMTDMFHGGANLRGISERQGLAVSKVVHQATLDMDETGAEAAAVTGISIGLTAIRFLVPVPVFKFSCPFMVIILERNTKEILFLGKIINPII
ncbi:hypothetical protein PFLUV_G00077270 [Perca fluviatilis]|uniref:Thyroxine-binding globulin n=1 Tax=Perca fluviatilis TaxID=8168 RepID=A0A6A5FBU6_PERFL|nr:serpin A3-1-like [Perca fluviatilis]KAF1389798.1 hypothetical protein PFLUV_G00077270 [Perca fluviatilis]